MVGSGSDLVNLNPDPKLWLPPLQLYSIISVYIFLWNTIGNFQLEFNWINYMRLTRPILCLNYVKSRDNLNYFQLPLLSFPTKGGRATKKTFFCVFPTYRQLFFPDLQMQNRIQNQCKTCSKRTIHIKLNTHPLKLQSGSEYLDRCPILLKFESGSVVCRVRSGPLQAGS